MLNKISIRFILLAIILVVSGWWWLAPSESVDSEQPESVPSRSEALVSAIQPINDADALTETGTLPELNTVTPVVVPTAAQKEEFAGANQALQAGRVEEAMRRFNGLIEQQPGFLEPYVNLAAALASQGDLEQARAILSKGLQVNNNYAALYDSLKKVHSALAADAYLMALSEDQTSQVATRALQLPLVSNLNPSVALTDTQSASRIASLEDRLADQQSQLSSAQQQLQTRAEEVSGLQEQLEVARSTAQMNDDATDTAQARINALQIRLQASEAQVDKLTVAHQAEVDKLTEQLARQQTEITQLQQVAAATQQASSQVPRQVTEPSPAVDVARNEPVEQVPSVPQVSAETAAIERSKSWAAAWSNQDVAAYIAHYRSGYTPPNSGLSNADWREQRRVRLTNKRFIEVSLSSFETQQSGNEVAVRFMQRYRSDRIDDTIRKELRFRAADGNWEDARIVGERIL